MGELAWRQRKDYLPKPAARIESAVVVALCLAILALYAVLALTEPDPRGYGTHERLGLTACSWPQVHGMPCPTCGVTTAAALLLHLRPLAAFATQPFGAVLTLLGGAFVVLAARHVLRGESLFARMTSWPWAWILGGGLALLLLSWLYRVQTWT